jgi:hypothetical protein
MLLDDLITALGDEKESLTGILLKTKVFLHQIGKKELAEWAQHELNGYPDASALPDYRQLPAQVKANVVSIAWRYTAHPLPTSHLSEEIKERFISGSITQPISVIEEWSDGEGGSIQRPIPMELNGLLGKKLQTGVHIEQAWAETPLADAKNILTQVRSRLLDFLLELRDSVGDADKPDEVKERADALDTSGMFNNAIFRGNTTILVGNQSSISATQANTSSDMAAEVRDLISQIRAALPTASLPEPIRERALKGVVELEAAIDGDQPDPSRLRQGLTFMQKTLEGAAGNLLASGALALIAKILSGGG